MQGALNQAKYLAWTPRSTKNVFLITDAPGHGRDICDWGDDYPDGSPDGFKLEDQMKEFAAQAITFTMVKVNERCNAMIDVMKKGYAAQGEQLVISDLAEACKSDSKEQVTAKFVKNASFILSASLGGPGKARPSGTVLWDTSKFELNQWFS